VWAAPLLQTPLVRPRSACLCSATAARTGIKSRPAVTVGSVALVTGPSLPLAANTWDASRPTVPRLRHTVHCKEGARREEVNRQKQSPRISNSCGSPPFVCTDNCFCKKSSVDGRHRLPQPTRSNIGQTDGRHLPLLSSIHIKSDATMTQISLRWSSVLKDTQHATLLHGCPDT
jgi:hypothetical protein